MKLYHKFSKMDVISTSVENVVIDLCKKFPWLDGNILEFLVEKKKTYLGKLLNMTLVTSSDDYLTSKILKLIGDLNEKNLVKLLNSPALFNVLRSSKGILALYEVLCIEKERILSEEELKIANVIPINDALPLLLRSPSSGLVAPRLLTPKEVKHAINLVEEGLNFLKSQSKFAVDLFMNLTSEVVLRVDTARQDETWGASSGIAIGRVVLVNFHRNYEVSMIAEILLHETVHNIFSCIDLVEPLAGTNKNAYQETANSPWTGNKLHINAFIHATLVWAIIGNYWQPLSQLPKLKKAAEKRLDFVRVGFTSSDFDDSLNKFCKHLPQRSIELLRHAKQTIVNE